jgi:Chaperone of endosialidase
LKILSLRPVTFYYKKDITGTPQFGLIAEEVAKVGTRARARNLTAGEKPGRWLIAIPRGRFKQNLGELSEDNYAVALNATTFAVSAAGLIFQYRSASSGRTTSR